MRFRSSVALGALLLFFRTLAAAAPDASTGVATPEILKLPDLVVTSAMDLPRPESWRYARQDRFEVLSAASDKETRALLRSLHDLNLALEVVWPALRRQDDRPFTLIVCKSEPELATFAPAQTEERRTDRAMGSVFLRERDRAAIVLLGGATILNVQAANATSVPGDMFAAGGSPLRLPADGVRAEPEQQLRHDYTLFLLSEVRPRLPAWVEEGLARLVMGMKISEKQLEFAKLEDPNAATIEQKTALNSEVPEGSTPADEDRQFQSALALSPLMGFPELFAVGHDSPVARNVIGSTWAKQAAAFVHLCLYGEGKRYQPGFLKFLTALSTQPPSEELFRSCFGMGYAQMGGVLRTYVLGAAYTSQEWNLRKGGAGFPKYVEPPLREATQAEVGRLKGETKLMAGKVESAGDELYVAYRRGERDPQLIGAIGVFDAAHGDKKRAAEFLAAAAKADVPSLPVYVTLARLRLEAAQARVGKDGALGAVDVEQVVAPLRRAAAQGLVSPELFELLAEAWNRSADKISKDDAVLLIRGALTYPNRLLLTYRAAAFAHDAGLEKEANALVERGLKLAPTEKERALFAALQAAFAKTAP